LQSSAAFYQEALDLWQAAGIDGKADNRLKVLFVIPPSSLKERYGDLLEAGAVYPSMGIAYVAAVAEADGHEVRVIDAEASGFDFEEINSLIRKFSPDVIGMQTFCANLPRCYQVARNAKSIDSKIKVVMGGVQATLFPHEQLEDPDVDFVVIGEGEYTFRHLLEVLAGGGDPSSVQGLAFKTSEGRVTVNPHRPLIKTLDELPFPALHLFPMECYHSSSQLRGNRTLHLLTSRGCPFNCSYCSGDLIFGKTFRFRSPGKVIEDIRRLQSDYQIDSIQFYDETFTVNRKRVLELCDAMDREGIRMSWACFARVDVVDEDLLKRMAKSGCYQIFFGVETGVPRLLESIRKGTTLDQARKAFQLTRKFGIETVASFMLTLPEETYQETLQTIKFGLELDPDYVYWLTFVPYPGTDLAQKALLSGEIINKDPTTYNVFNEIVYVPAGRNADEIRKTVAWAYRRFYLRPKYILRQFVKLFRLPPKKSWNLIKGGIRTFLKKKV
jgi:anaerobic magnesium-protoporphyrin IX monomethyl ester cyclase